MTIMFVLKTAARLTSQGFTSVQINMPVARIDGDLLWSARHPAQPGFFAKCLKAPSPRPELPIRLAATRTA
jgi:hypothetical protein